MRAYADSDMDTWILSILLALGVSADALACGFSAGAARIKVPLCSAFAAAAVSAAFVALGLAAGAMSAPLLPENVGRYVSFGVLAVFGLGKLADDGGNAAAFDARPDKVLSVPEGLALGSAISVDGLAVGFGTAMRGITAALACGCTLLFTAGALWLGARGGRSTGGGRTGNIAAGLTLVILAVQKLWGGG